MARLQTIVAERAAWEKSLRQVKRMHQWVLDVEHLLDGNWAKPGERRSLAKVGRRFDRWRKSLAGHLTDGTLSPLEQECLQQFLQVLSNLRPHLIECYNREAFPRTNNELERSIRSLKTRYRRISGRKNWNSYLLRYGRCVAYYDWWGWCSTPPVWIAPTGESSAARPKPHRASNSSAFAFAISARPISPR